MERMGYDLTKGSSLNFDKEKRVLLHSFNQKVKTLITITGPEEDLVMYLRQSRQISSLKKRSILTSHQQHHHGTQMSTSAISSKVSVNMISTSHLEDDREDSFESEELIQSDSDP